MFGFGLAWDPTKQARGMGLLEARGAGGKLPLQLPPQTIDKSHFSQGPTLGLGFYFLSFFFF